jgi:hypothetical protein
LPEFIYDSNGNKCGTIWESIAWYMQLLG